MSASRALKFLSTFSALANYEPAVDYLQFIGGGSQALRTRKASLESGPGEEIIPACDFQTSALSTRAFKLPILLIFNYCSNGSGCSFVSTPGRLRPVISSKQRGQKFSLARADVACG